MAVRGAEISRPGGEGDTRLTPADGSGRAPLAPTLVLIVLLALAGFALAMAVVTAVTEPKSLGALGSENQRAESALYLGSFGILLPLALFFVPRLADRIAAGPNGEAFPLLTWLLASLLVVLVFAARLSAHLPWDDGVATVAMAAALFTAVAASALRRAASDERWDGLVAKAGRTPAVATAAAALTIAMPLCFVALGSLSAGVVLIGVVAGAAALALYGRRRLLSLPGRWGLVADLAILVIVCLVIPDVVIFRPGDPSNGFLDNYKIGIIQFHQDFILGPAHEVVSGGSVLVDTASQYGVGPVYLLAGWFGLTKEGYGTYGFLDGILYALFFSAGYLMLRMAGVSRLLAGTTLGIAVVTLLLNLTYPIGGLPQQGPLRFGLPMALILFTVLGAARPRTFGAMRVAGYAVIGISAVWAIEAFSYTVVTFAGIVAFEVLEIDRGERRRWLVRRLGAALAACIAVHLALVIFTLIRAGELPHWNQYLAFLNAFLFKGLGDLTYDFSTWSGGFAVGAFYFTSIVALVLIVRRHREVIEADRTAYLALAGMSAFGAVLFSYFVDRSSDGILPAVCFPALLLGALWLSLVMRTPGVGDRVARGALAGALAVALLIVGAAWSSVDERLPDTFLAQAMPGGESLRDSLHRLWNPPALNPASPPGEALVEKYFPDQDRIPIVAVPDVQTEILLRTGRTDQFRLTDAWEDSFVSDQRLPGVEKGVSELRAGDLMLVDKGALAAFTQLKRDGSFNSILRIAGVGKLAPLQSVALREIAKEFSLRPVERDPSGMTVVRLAPRMGSVPAQPAGPAG